MPRIYNDPANGQPSNIGSQFNTFFYAKKALIEAQREQYFMQLADVASMPKHFGKTMKKYHYLPLLDEANVNDQGIDATGATIADGNLYGSSKDVGTISGKLPALSETGGRVNRVGFKRIEIEGSIEKFGFFDEYTQESMDFDTDEELEMHVYREMMNGASEITEDALQIDLLNAAGVVRFAGDATQDSEITGEDGAALQSVVTYDDLIKLGIELDQNRTPKHTKIITGTRMIDTKVVHSARYMYVGSELLPTMQQMKDYHNEKAFIGVEHYAAAGTVARGEVGKVGDFRMIVVPEMMRWEGAGGAVTTNGGFYATAGNYDIFPMLVVGDASFSTIGFQTDGKTVKFKVTHKKPGEDTADRNDPYGETGFMSIKWYYGTMILRPERIALIKTAAKM